MSLARLPYRARQFWLALVAQPDAGGLQMARQLLGPSLWEIFTAMQPGEQQHSLNIVRQLQSQGEDALDLLVAALLHDAGKSLRPLRLWERAWIVIYSRLLSGSLRRWSALDPQQVRRLPFWQQPLAVAACHPAWGADLAAASGASDLVVTLIRAHQEPNPFPPGSLPDQMLAALQRVDDEN